MDKANVGEWTNVAMTICEKDVRFYHDGEMIYNYKMRDLVPPFDSQALYLGRDNGIKRYVGLMDEVMLFDETLSSHEIKEISDLMQL